MYTTTNQIKQKQIVICNTRWTRGNDYYYLVTFSHPTSEWMGAYRILIGGDRYRNEDTKIRREYIGTRNLDGYVNVFTGGTAINVNDVTEVKGFVPDDVYSRVTSAMLAVFTGRSDIEDGYYKIKSGAITIDPSFILQAYMSGSDLPSRKVISASLKPKCEKVPEDEEQVVEEIEEETEEIEYDDDSNTVVIDKEFTKEDYDRLKEAYDNLETPDARLDHIFHFYTDHYGRIYPGRVYNMLIKGGCNSGIYRNRKSGVMLTKSEFMMVLNNPIDVLAKYTFDTYANGKMTIPNSSITALKSNVKRIYENKKVIPRSFEIKRIPKDISDKINQMIDERVSLNKIIKEYPEHKQQIVARYNNSNEERGSKAIKNKLLKLTGHKDEDVVNIAKYFINHYDMIGSFSKGYIPDNFKFNIQKARMIAIHCVNYRWISQIIALTLPAYVNTKEGFDLMRSLVHTNAKSSLEGVLNISKASESDEALRETIYFAYCMKSQNREIPDGFTNVDNDMIGILKVSTDRYLEQKAYVKEHIEEYHSWIKSLRKKRRGA